MALCKNADPATAAKAKEFLMSELMDLETMKGQMGEGVDKEHMQMAVENFVMSVFA
jgi:hypothetical protein